ncbi:MAG: DUF998 domain-containing protein [Theionarchaea archaeon]|nr:DUF998 domain-containing protein [Theionarchaea archaeon]MBU7038401.1 DUF998 domain-containing protein [Theionarchaea archaeon]
MVETARILRFFLVCGILSSLLYVSTDILAGMLWEGYDFASQSASELSALGASTRPFVLPLELTADVLLIAFALGVWVSAGRNRALRVTGGLLAANAVTALVAVAFFPVHPGEAMTASANTMNVVLMGLSVLFLLVAMGFGAAACQNWFRFYSIGTFLVFLVEDILATMGAPRAIRGQSGPLVGIQERTMIYGCLLWIVVLAIVLLRAEKK